MLFFIEIEHHNLIVLALGAHKMKKNLSGPSSVTFTRLALTGLLIISLILLVKTGQAADQTKTNRWYKVVNPSALHGLDSITCCQTILLKTDQGNIPVEVAIYNESISYIMVSILTWENGLTTSPKHYEYEVKFSYSGSHFPSVIGKRVRSATGFYPKDQPVSLIILESATNFIPAHIVKQLHDLAYFYQANTRSACALQGATETGQ